MPHAVEYAPKITLPDVLPIEQTEKPEWMKLRERIVRARNNPEETKFLLNTLKKEGSRDFIVALGILWSLPAEIPENYVAKILSHSIEFINSPVGILEKIGATWLGKVGVIHPDKIMPVIKGLAKDRTRGYAKTAAIALGELGVEHPDEAIPILKKLAERTDVFVCGSAILALGKVGVEHPDRVIPLLKKYVEDEKWFVRRAATIALDKALKKIETDTNDIARNKESLSRRLISYREPAYATPKLNAIDKRMNALTDIRQKLCNEFPDLVGLVVFGSTEKGDMDTTSDVDCALIGEVNQDVRDRLKNLAKEHNIPLDSHTFKVVNDSTIGYADLLFNGLFFGDRKRLSEIQRKFLSKITGEEWDNLRKLHIEQNINQRLYKFGLNEEETWEIAVIRTILYTLPDLDTMKKELGVVCV